MQRIFPSLVLAVACSAGPLAAQSKNLLFYGNSYTQWNGTAGAIVGLIAEEAGHPIPFVVQALIGGATLQTHRFHASQVAFIHNSLPPDNTWDFVVMQGQSLEATFTSGNPVNFRNNAVGIVANVRGHSPAARAILFQTWARAEGHSFYPGTYPTPYAMRGEIETNYGLATQDINNVWGNGTAVHARPGDGVSLLGHAAANYAPDLTHPGPRMTLLTAMAIFTAAYQERVCDLQPDFGGSSNLVLHLTSLGLDAEDWREMAGLADRVADPSLRAQPGSSEDLLLQSGVHAPVDASPEKPISLGSWISLETSSPNGVYASAPLLVFLDAFVQGGAPGPDATYPELRFDLSRALIYTSVSSVGGSGKTVPVIIPFQLSGYSLLFQSVAFAPSAMNPAFTATDAHVFSF